MGKSKLRIILGITIALLGLLCIIFAVVYQGILSYRFFGVVFTKYIFIPHWSAWFYLGVVPMYVGFEIMR